MQIQPYSSSMASMHTFELFSLILISFTVMLAMIEDEADKALSYQTCDRASGWQWVALIANMLFMMILVFHMSCGSMTKHVQRVKKSRVGSPVSLAFVDDEDSDTVVRCDAIELEEVPAPSNQATLTHGGRNSP